MTYDEIFKNCTIEFTDGNLIKVKFNDGYGSLVKYITFNEFAECMIAAKQKFEIKPPEEAVYYDTPVLPANSIYTIFHRECSKGYRFVLLLREAKPCDMIYYEDIYKNVGIPKMLCMVAVIKNVIQHLAIVCVKDTVVTEDSLIYRYPFSNVAGIGDVCLGSNNISKLDIQNYAMLHSIPNMFLAMPNSDHSYTNENNLSRLKYRPLLEALVDKPFPDEWLKPLNKQIKVDNKYIDEQYTLSTWLENFK